MTVKNKLENSQDILDLDQFIPAILTGLGRQLSYSASAQLSESVGLNIIDWRIMTALVQRPGLSASQLVEKCVYDKALISRRLKVLNQMKYVKTKPRKPNSNRTQSSLTAKGHGIHSKLLQIVREREQVTLAGFTAVEKKNLLKMLDRVRLNISANPEKQV